MLEKRLLPLLRLAPDQNATANLASSLCAPASGKRRARPAQHAACKQQALPPTAPTPALPQPTAPASHVTAARPATGTCLPTSTCHLPHLCTPPRHLRRVVVEPDLLSEPHARTT